MEPALDAAHAAVKKAGIEMPEDGAGLENVDIRAVMNCELPTVACVLLRAGDSTAEEEVQVDMTPKAQASQKLLGGDLSFLGQWPEMGVVLVHRRDGQEEGAGAAETLPLNQHKLQPPFHKAAVRGDILLMRVAEDGAPLDFKAAEYAAFKAKEIEEWEPEAPASTADMLSREGAEAEGEDEDEDGDYNAEEDEDESDEDDEDDEEGEEGHMGGLMEMLSASVFKKFVAENGREPTEEERQNLMEAIQSKLGAMAGIEEGDEEEEEDEEDEGEDEGEFAVGDVVEISGIQGRPELNGQRGSVTGPAPNDRFMVCLETSEETVSLKPTNLTAVAQAAEEPRPKQEAGEDEIEEEKAGEGEVVKAKAEGVQAQAAGEEEREEVLSNGAKAAVEKSAAGGAKNARVSPLADKDTNVLKKAKTTPA